MAGESQEWIDTAKEMFDDAGDVIKNATLKHFDASNIKPGTGGAPTEATTTCRVFFDLDRQYVSTFLRDMVIEPSMRLMMLQGGEFAPSKGDTLEISGMEDITLQFVNDVAQIGAIFIAIGE